VPMVQCSRCGEFFPASTGGRSDSDAPLCLRCQRVVMTERPAETSSAASFASSAPSPTPPSTRSEQGSDATGPDELSPAAAAPAERSVDSGLPGSVGSEPRTAFSRRSPSVAPTTSGAPLQVAHRALLAAYRSASQRSDAEASPTDLYVRHVLAVSSRRAAERLDTHVGDDELTEPTQRLAKGYDAEDLLGRASRFLASEAGKQVAKYVVAAGGIGLVAGTIISFLKDLLAEGEALGHHAAALWASGAFSGLTVYALIQLGRGLAQQQYHSIQIYPSSAATRKLLAETLDQAERRFFSALSSVPPSRPLLTAVPVAVVVTLIVAAGVLLVLVVGVVSGFNTPSPRAQ
jgi:hypothetical protein